MKTLTGFLLFSALSTTFNAAAADHQILAAATPSPNLVRMPLTDVRAAVAVVSRSNVPASDLAATPMSSVRRAAARLPTLAPSLSPSQTLHPLPTSPTTPLGFRRADFAWSHEERADTRAGLSRNAHDASVGISTRVVK